MQTQTQDQVRKPKKTKRKLRDSLRSKANKEVTIGCCKNKLWSGTWGWVFGVVALLVSIATMIIAIVVIIREYQTQVKGLKELVDEVYPAPAEPPEEVSYLLGSSSFDGDWDSDKAQGWAITVGVLNICKAVAGVIAIILFWPTNEDPDDPSSTQESLVWSFSVPCVVVYGTISAFILAHVSGDGPLLSQFLTISIASEILIMVVGFMMLRFWHSEDKPNPNANSSDKEPLMKGDN